MMTSRALLAGKAIPTRRTNMSTPMPKSHDPFRGQAQSQAASRADLKEKEEREPSSAKGTIRGAPAIARKEAEPATELQSAIETPFGEPAESESPPFEEPKVDEFGTGFGV